MTGRRHTVVTDEQEQPCLHTPTYPLALNKGRQVWAKLVNCGLWVWICVMSQRVFMPVIHSSILVHMWEIFVNDFKWTAGTHLTFRWDCNCLLVCVILHTYFLRPFLFSFCWDLSGGSELIECGGPHFIRQFLHIERHLSNNPNGGGYLGCINFAVCILNI